MESYIAKKHWWYWVLPIMLSVLFVWTLILPIFIILYAYLRWKFDKIEIKDRCLYSKMGLIFIDKKTIPLEQISFISEKCDIISQSLGFASIQVQSSAFAKAITYPCIDKPQELIKFVNENKKRK